MVKNHRRRHGAGRKRREVKEVPTDALTEFFAEFPPFNYNPQNGSTREFYRMCDVFEWHRHAMERDDAYRDFKDALVKQFNYVYGTNVDDIRTWQGLCIALDVNPIPETPTEAKKELKGRFINLVDLVDRDATGDSVYQFENLQELQEYTKSTGKFFPKESAYAGGVLKFLLRKILT